MNDGVQSVTGGGMKALDKMIAGNAKRNKKKAKKKKKK